MGGYVWPLDKPLNLFYLLTSLLLIHNGWFLNQNSPYGSGAWFLDVLFLTYIIFWCIGFIRNRKLYRGVLLFLILFGWFCSSKSFDFMFMYQKTGRGIWMFFTGMLLFEVYEKLKFNNGLKIAKYIGYINLCICAVDIASRLIFNNHIFGDIRMFFSAYFIPSTFFACLYLVRNPRKVRFVKYTMSIYMQHALVIAEVQMANLFWGMKLDYSSLRIFAIVFFIIILQSLFAYYVIERVITKKINYKIEKSIIDL